MDTVHVLVALRRKKDSENEGRETVCHKRVIDDFCRDDIEQFKNSIGEDGYWRMYRTVNERDTDKAMKELQIEIIKNGDTFKHKIASKWKSILMQPKCKAENYWLIDVDDRELVFTVEAYLEEVTDIIETAVTPNGYHFVVNGFDNREFLEKFKNDPVEIKKDALIYLEDFIIKNKEKENV